MFSSYFLYCRSVFVLCLCFVGQFSFELDRSRIKFNIKLFNYGKVLSWSAQNTHTHTVNNTRQNFTDKIHNQTTFSLLLLSLLLAISFNTINFSIIVCYFQPIHSAYICKVNSFSLSFYCFALPVCGVYNINQSRRFK